MYVFLKVLENVTSFIIGRSRRNVENFNSICHKVNRCLARYSPRATTTNQMSQQGLVLNEQKFHFWATFGLLWAKNPNFYWRNQKFCHPHTENPPRHLVHNGFLSGIGQNVKKWQYLAQNDQKCRFWTNFGRFWAKNPNFYGSK